MFDELGMRMKGYEIDTDAWFGYRTDKLCSIAASMATLYFNREFEKLYLEELGYYLEYDGDVGDNVPNFVLAHDSARKRGATFDARCFNIPKEEVTNLIYWRQLDATRNSIQMVGQTNFSHQELMNKSCNMIQDMLHEQKGINWNDFSTAEKRGSCCIKQEIVEDIVLGNGSVVPTARRSKWVIDRDIPIFKGENRNYIEERINF